MAEKDGGPAFATGNPEQGGQGGMSLLDWFAGQVDVGNYAPYLTFKKANNRDPTIEELAHYIAKIRYIEARAMLVERGLKE